MSTTILSVSLLLVIGTADPSDNVLIFEPSDNVLVLEPSDNVVVLPSDGAVDLNMGAPKEPCLEEAVVAVLQRDQDTLALWETTLVLLRQHFSEIRHIQVALQPDAETQSSRGVMLVTLNLGLDVDATWKAYESFVTAWSERVPIDAQEQFRFLCDVV